MVRNAPDPPPGDRRDQIAPASAPGPPRARGVLISLSARLPHVEPRVDARPVHLLVTRQLLLARARERALEGSHLEIIEPGRPHVLVPVACPPVKCGLIVHAHPHLPRQRRAAHVALLAGHRVADTVYPTGPVPYSRVRCHLSLPGGISFKDTMRQISRCLVALVLKDKPMKLRQMSALLDSTTLLLEGARVRRVAPDAQRAAARPDLHHPALRSLVAVPPRDCELQFNPWQHADLDEPRAFGDYCPPSMFMLFAVCRLPPRAVPHHGDHVTEPDVWFSHFTSLV